jgi:hypothetical protein
MALECFSDINELIGQNGEYALLEKNLSEQTPKPEEEKLTYKVIVDGILRLSENEQNIACGLLKRLGVPIQRAINHPVASYRVLKSKKR